MTVTEASQVSGSIEELDAMLDQVSKTYWETRARIIKIEGGYGCAKNTLHELNEAYRNKRALIDRQLADLDKLERIEGRAACMAVLRATDGVRRTWQRMLEPGAAGSGIMPWVSNVGWWDVGGYRTTDMTFGAPILTPAFVEWRAPTEEDISHFDLPYPFVMLTRLTFVGSDRSEIWEPLGNNAESCEICDDLHGSEIMEEHGVAVPVWSVNPIETALVDDWCKVAQKQWDANWELSLIDYLSGNMDHHWPVTDANGIETECAAEENYVSECNCGVADGEALLDANLEAGAYMPNLDGFLPTWERTVGRWTLGWFEIHRINGNKALRQSVVRLSPFRG